MSSSGNKTVFFTRSHLKKREKVNMEKMFKSKLQELCHQKRWALPIYSCKKDGADHNPQFKASVVVNGINFDTTSISRSLKEAHNAAAKLAFLYFTSGECSTTKTLD